MICAWVVSVTAPTLRAEQPGEGPEPPEVGEELKGKIGDRVSDEEGGWLAAAGDASGGEHTVDPRLERVAWARGILNRTEGAPLSTLEVAEGPLSGGRASIAASFTR